MDWQNDHWPYYKSFTEAFIAFIKRYFLAFLGSIAQPMHGSAFITPVYTSGGILQGDP